MKAIPRSRQSAYVLRAGILRFYESCELFPSGLRSDMEAVQDWALKLGSALKRLVAQLHAEGGSMVHMLFVGEC